MSEPMEGDNTKAVSKVRVLAVSAITFMLTMCRLTSTVCSEDQSQMSSSHHGCSARPSPLAAQRGACDMHLRVQHVVVSRVYRAGDDHFDGAIDDFRWWSRPLTADEIEGMWLQVHATARTCTCRADACVYIQKHTSGDDLKPWKGLLGHFRFEGNADDSHPSHWKSTVNNFFPGNAWAREAPEV